MSIPLHFRRWRQTLTSQFGTARSDLAAAIFWGYCLTQRTETAICFWPWAPR
jgi:hypothetical protein